MSSALALPRPTARAPPPPPPRACTACLQCARPRFAAPAGGAARAPRPLIAPPGAGGQGPAERPASGAEAGAAAPDVARETEAEAPPESAGVRAALAALRFYKVAISPLLPPSCRFLPTCSSYAVEAYKRHGVARGTVLTAWRLLRCNPFNPGRGYDPVAWPPPGLGWMFGAAGGE